MYSKKKYRGTYLTIYFKNLLTAISNKIKGYILNF